MWLRAIDDDGADVDAFEVVQGRALPPGVRYVNYDNHTYRLVLEDGRSEPLPWGCWLVRRGEVVRIEPVAPILRAEPEPQFYPVEPYPQLESDTPPVFLKEVPKGKRATRYTFDRGAGLGLHHHGPDNNHYTLMIAGEIECYGRASIEGLVLRPGDCVDWSVPGEPHGLRARIDGTVFDQLRPWP